MLYIDIVKNKIKDEKIRIKNNKIKVNIPHIFKKGNSTKHFLCLINN